MAGVLYVIFVPRGQVHLPFTAAPGGARAMFLMGSLSLITAIGLGTLIVRREPGYVRLTLDGLVNADVLRTRTTSWADITDITDTAPTRSPYQPMCVMVKGSKPIVISNLGGYAPSGAALYWMVRHYWKHPERRDELTDGRALERLRTEDFEPE